MSVVCCRGGPSVSHQVGSSASHQGGPSASHQGSKPANALVGTIRRLTGGEAPDPAELTAAFDVVLAGDATPVQIAALLVGLRVKGETPVELAAVVRAFRQARVVLPAGAPG